MINLILIAPQRYVSSEDSILPSYVKNRSWTVQQCRYIKTTYHEHTVEGWCRCTLISTLALVNYHRKNRKQNSL
jgi:hypothetical protein